MNKKEYKYISSWIDKNSKKLSNWNQIIWNLAEPAWREYESSKLYIEILKKNNFKVEECSAGMPTAFCAEWENGSGPTLATYAEYDAVPGQCQDAVPFKKPRAGFSENASGHTDPHSALGISALGGLLATKAAMQKFNLSGKLYFTGEPAEKLRGSKPIHAAKGYYDNIDAMISFHPCYMLPWCNTVRWDIHCGAAYALIYRFKMKNKGAWLGGDITNLAPIPHSHAEVRSPSADEALIQMYTSSRNLRDTMLPHSKSWSMNEIILTSGQATADNLPSNIAELQYMIRVSTLDEANKVIQFLDRNAEAAAKITNCSYTKHWVSKSRPGIPNHTISNLVFESLKQVGPPKWGKDAKKFANEIRKNLGLQKVREPFLKETSEIINPQKADLIIKKNLPPSQNNFTSDDYTEMCWHTPTARLYVGRPMLDSFQKEYFPNWVMNALGGVPETIDPMIFTASKTIALSFLKMLKNPLILKDAKREFNKRTKGGINGENWIPPLCDYNPPIHYSWPDYKSTMTGKVW